MRLKIILSLIIVALLFISASVYFAHIDKEPATPEEIGPSHENISIEEKAQILERLKSLGYLK
ncbi:MAG: hypothetical protein NDI94_04470 [Candidatus Woesearchaeota archaeon]|nr:hypothetical protein [Candidatus Woesearchaeota archaeon]